MTETRTTTTQPRFWIEYHSVADAHGNRRFTLYWLTDYTIDKVNRKSVNVDGVECWPRAQEYNADPKQFEDAVEGRPDWYKR